MATAKTNYKHKRGGDVVITKSKWNDEAFRVYIKPIKGKMFCYHDIKGADNIPDVMDNLIAYVDTHKNGCIIKGG